MIEIILKKYIGINETQTLLEADKNRSEVKSKGRKGFFQDKVKGTLTFVAFENYSTFKLSRLPPMPHPLSVCTKLSVIF